jgi:hypothetical protein
VLSVLISVPDLRNYIYDLIAKSTEYTPSIEICTKPSVFSEQHVYHWGFLGLTQVSRTLRTEFRPLYMAKLRVTIELPDVPAIMESFLATVLTESRSGPTALFVRLDDQDYSWHQVSELDLAPVLRIMCTTLSSPTIKFICRDDFLDWVSPFLNQASTRKSAWNEAFHKHHIHRVILHVSSSSRHIILHISPQVKSPCQHDPQDYEICEMGLACPIWRLLVDLGITEDVDDIGFVECAQ